MDEKEQILAMKVPTSEIARYEMVGVDDEGKPVFGTTTPGESYSAGAASAAGATVVGGVAGVGGASGMVGVAGVAPAPVDPLADNVEGIAAGAMAGGVMGVGGSIEGAEISSDTISNAAAAAATAAAQAKSTAEEQERANATRFPKLAAVDEKYREYEWPEFNNEITLEQICDGYRKFACSQLHLYYTPEIVRRFVAGMASSQILILEGISGTGKTSLPYSFSRYLDNPATMISVQPSYRERTDLLGYFNEFSKKFNETEFLRAVYEAGFRSDVSMIVLDEMNLARIEYYFADMLSVLEMPDKKEWTVELVPTPWPGDPELLQGGKILVHDNTWFIGTANNDDSTFTITDKVYDRAMPIELNQKADPFECPLEPKLLVTSEHLRELFANAKEEHPISDSTLAKMVKLDAYLQSRFKLAFGNRITKQMHDFIPVYVACGGTELGGLDYIFARKILKKFESQNVMFIRDEIKNLMAYMEKVFGKNEMRDSQDYLARVQNLY
jgi:MoxR-like ATPase